MKVYVSKDFLQTTHGKIECVDCHRGNKKGETKKAAHKDFLAMPSVDDPDKACGVCHEDITSTAPQSLHATLSPYKKILKARSDHSRWKEIDIARDRHCGSCHTGCGGCHVSRPKAAEGGLLDGHKFNRKPEVVNQCSACHGSRIGNEYFGKRGQGDVHAQKYEMDCISCHKAGEMHAAAPGDIDGRYQLKESVRCEDCHNSLGKNSMEQHTIHNGRVQCQVCHSQTYVNCYSCHTGTDKEGLPYYINQRHEEEMKIGLNYEKNTSGTDYNYMLVRHVPMNKDLFGFYVKDAFTNFDRIPTWKRTSPHNIQRKTWQNTDCNNCHGKRELFLSLTDILQNEITANTSVIVPDDRVPQKTDRPDPCPAESGLVKQDRIVQKEWLYQHLSSTELVIIDARTNEEYGKGHIKGAIHFDALLADGGVRWPWHAPKPAHLKGPDLLSEILGSIGIRNDRHIIVYDKDGWRSGFLLAVLEYAGAGHISFLEGGIQAWKEAGYTVSYDDIKSEPAAFVVKARPEFLVDNAYVKNNQYNPGVIIADVRSLDHSNALTKHEQAISKGRIPGSVKFPFTSLYMDNAELKSPGELLFVLRTKGITPDKTIVLTSETGARAGSVFFILRYLGYPDVRIHEASWVGWFDENCDPAD